MLPCETCIDGVRSVTGRAEWTRWSDGDSSVRDWLSFKGDSAPVVDLRGKPPGGRVYP
ncbi:hypothetical protein BDM02DRAFT_3117852 [Thelephora ganbajun]|uniref:Uncharacterized protein n=1 Tax=Thelephora ganbajun TaxID=370292 RepID=A0ACB6ZAY9_THEGA|nr:hypothetical protein BDM02DRAFT_3117852 [Thelephora ganbajun]